MDTIEHYRELCTDGHAVGDQPRPPAAMERWKSSTVVRLQWTCAGEGIQVEHLYGLSAQVLPDRRGVAVLRSPPHGRFATAIEFLDARGNPRFTLASPVQIEGQSVAGEFAWFETPADQSQPVVRVVFWALADDRYYLLDVSSADGAISGVLPLQ